MNKKTILTSVALLFAAIAVALFFSNKFLSDYTDNLLQRRLSENPHQLYNISYENLKLDLLNGEITLEKIRMDIDSSFADSLKKNNRYPHTLYSGQVNELRLTGISAFDIYWNKVIRVNTLFINQPEIELLITHSADSVKPFSAMAGDGIKELLEYINHSKINSVNLEKGKLQVSSESSTERRKIGQAEDFSLNVLNFEIDSSQPNEPYVVEEVKIGFKLAEFDISTGYFLKLNSFNLSLKDSSLVAEQLKLIPKQTKKQFTNSYRYIKNRIDLQVAEIRGQSVNFHSLIFNESIDIQTLEIEKPLLGIYRDRTKDWPIKGSFSTVYEMVNQIPIPINISEIKVKNGALKNEQLLANHEEPASITMDKCYFSIFNVTNDSISLSQNNKMEVAIQMDVLNTSTIRGNATFDLTNPNQLFDFTVNMSKTPLSPFSKLIKQFMHIELATGELHEASVTIQGNKHHISGYTEIDYSNATLAIEQKGTGFFSKLKKNLLSGIANTVIRNDNRKGTPHFKKGRIDYNYNTKLPFVRNVWLATQLGMLDTMLPFPASI